MCSLFFEACPAFAFGSGSRFWQAVLVSPGPDTKKP